MYVGNPMDMASVVEQCYHGNREQGGHGNRLTPPSAVVVRKQITDAIQERMREMRVKAEELHTSWNCTSKVAYRQL